MPLEVGRRLGPYEVLAPLGRGGMGEVYRARDTRLERQVAIKVLPETLESSPERRRRLEREAKTISSLSHPHICTLHDVGEDRGRFFLVMELVEGPNLAEVLAKDPMPMDDVLRIGREVAEALAAAHRAGIVHRDLKPANVVRTRSGAKLLDFGLAGLFRREPHPAPESWSSLTTAEQPPSAEGALLGTLPYMAPEQLAGGPVDARTDIFALGALLHEMATRQRAFVGRSRSDLVASIVGRQPPPISTLVPDSPGVLDVVVERCLAKQPEDRWQSAADVAAVLGLRSGPRETPPSHAHRERRGWLLPATALGGLLMGVVGARLVTRVPTRTTVADVRLSVNPPTGAVLASTHPPALSPDGSRLVFQATVAGTTRLFLRDISQLVAKPIPHTEGADMPFFSPDGDWLGFAAEGKLKKVRLATGSEPLVLCDAPDPRGASWGERDLIAFTRSPYEGLFKVTGAGGLVQPMTALAESDAVISHRWPQVLPGGKAVLYATMTRRFDEDGRDLVALDLDTGRAHVLLKGVLYARYLAPRHLLYARGGLVLAVPFDPVRLQVQGEAVPVLQDVTMFPRSSGGALFSTSSQGGVAFVPGYGRSLDRRLAFVDRKGRATPVTQARRPYKNPVLSPDNRHVAVTVEGATSDDVWVGDLVRDTWSRLTVEGDNDMAAWMPDGRSILFGTSRGTSFGFFLLPRDGGSNPEAMTRGDTQWGWDPIAVSPDGRTLAFGGYARSRSMDVWVVERGRPDSVQAFLQGAADESGPSFSPDGRYLAYSSNESRRSEIYVRSFLAGTEGRRVSDSGGRHAVWTRSGEIFYLQSNWMMRVGATTGGELRLSAPEKLFEIPEDTRSLGRNFDVSADGQRFLMVEAPPAPYPPQIVVVPGLREEIRD